MAWHGYRIKSSNARSDEAESHNTIPPNCTRRLKRIARNGSAVFDAHFTIRVSEIPQDSDASPFHVTTQPIFTIRLRQLPRYDSAKFGGATLLNSAKFGDTTQPTFRIRFSRIARYGSAELHDTT